MSNHAWFVSETVEDDEPRLSKGQAKLKLILPSYNYLNIDLMLGYALLFFAVVLSLNDLDSVIFIR